MSVQKGPCAGIERNVGVERITGETSRCLRPTVESDEQLRSETGGLDGVQGQLVTCGLDKLRPHPSYVRHHLAVSASQLSALAELGDLGFREPLVITLDHIIIDGYARWGLARLQGRPTLPCILYKMSEVEALESLLQRHRRSSGLNDFIRICLALELEPLFKEKARANQQAGGQNKGSSNLTEAGRLDVRNEIARLAGVSVGNVTKVKQLTTTAHSDIIRALREKELSIHRAWLWSKLSSEEQREALWRYQSEGGIRKIIRNLVSGYRPKSSPSAPEVGDLIRLLGALQSGKLGSVRVLSIKVPGKTIFVTEELSRSLGEQEQLALTCATNNR
jgi:hypothetical protein